MIYLRLMFQIRWSPLCKKIVVYGASEGADVFALTLPELDYRSDHRC